MKQQRSRDYEEQFLGLAAHAAGLSGSSAEQFRERVWRRMENSDRADADFWRRGFEKVVAEGRVEAEDIAAYCLGAAQVLGSGDDAVHSEVEHAVRMHLLEAISASLRAWSHLEAAAGMYRDHSDGRPVTVQRPRAISDSVMPGA